MCGRVVGVDGVIVSSCGWSLSSLPTLFLVGRHRSAVIFRQKTEVVVTSATSHADEFGRVEDCVFRVDGCSETGRQEVGGERWWRGGGGVGSSRGCASRAADEGGGSVWAVEGGEEGWTRQNVNCRKILGKDCGSGKKTGSARGQVGINKWKQRGMERKADGRKISDFSSRGSAECTSSSSQQQGTSVENKVRQSVAHTR